MPDSLMAELDVIERALQAFDGLNVAVNLYRHEDDSTCEWRVRAGDIRALSTALAALPAIRQALALAEQQQAEIERLKRELDEATALRNRDCFAADVIQKLSQESLDAARAEIERLKLQVRDQARELLNVDGDERDAAQAEVARLRKVLEEAAGHLSEWRGTEVRASVAGQGTLEGMGR